MISCPQQKLQPPISLKKKQKKRHGNRENMVVVLVGETLRGSPPKKKPKKTLDFSVGMAGLHPLYRFAFCKKKST